MFRSPRPPASKGVEGLARVGSRAALSFAFAFLRRAWRSGEHTGDWLGGSIEQRGDWRGAQVNKMVIWLDGSVNKDRIGWEVSGAN